MKKSDKEIVRMEFCLEWDPTDGWKSKSDVLKWVGKSLRADGKEGQLVTVVGAEDSEVYIKITPYEDPMITPHENKPTLPGKALDNAVKNMKK